ncbi:ABC transporter ATP-binding protein [bacterium]|nr:ABC transporter ATP-binding protein [bacterium]
MKIVKVENVSKVYIRKYLCKVQKKVALKGLNLEIAEKQVFGLLGLNGSGKTTTIKLLLGLLFPNKGNLFIFDKKIPNLEIRKKIGYLPEASYFFKYLTAKELLFFYAELSSLTGKEKQKRVDWVLEFVELKEAEKVRLADFSKGMLQRIAMAQALLHNPELLFLDEPTGGLDPVGIKKMRELILRLRDERKTVFFSSHFINEVEKVCNYVGILHKGELKKTLEVPGLNGRLEDIFIQTISE